MLGGSGEGWRGSGEGRHVAPAQLELLDVARHVLGDGERARLRAGRDAGAVARGAARADVAPG